MHAALQELAAANVHASSPARVDAAAVGESGGGEHNTPSPRAQSTPTPGAAAKAWRSDGVRRSSSFSPDESPPATAAAARALLFLADGGSLCDSGLGVQEPGSEVAGSDMMGDDDEHVLDTPLRTEEQEMRAMETEIKATMKLPVRHSLCPPWRPAGSLLSPLFTPLPYSLARSFLLRPCRLPVIVAGGMFSFHFRARKPTVNNRAPPERHTGAWNAAS